VKIKGKKNKNRIFNSAQLPKTRFVQGETILGPTCRPNRTEQSQQTILEKSGAQVQQNQKFAETGFTPKAAQTT
jgi:hypothetical protein